jgi:hypothetical protein
LASLVGVGVQEITPAADLGDDHVVPGEGFTRRTEAVGVLERDIRAIGGAVAEGAVGQR